MTRTDPQWTACRYCGAAYAWNYYGDQCPRCQGFQSPPARPVPGNQWAPQPQPIPRPRLTVSEFLATQHSWAWRLVGRAMTPTSGPTAGTLRSVMSVVAVCSVFFAYLYWSAEGLSITEGMDSALATTLRIFQVSIVLLVAAGLGSLIFPAHLAAADRFWLIRRYQGPVIALGTFLLTLYFGVFLCITIVLVPMVVAGIANAFRLAVKHQFRLGEVHPVFPAVCALVVGGLGLADSIGRVSAQGLNPDFPIVVAVLIVFGGPLATAALAAFDLRLTVGRR